MTEAKTRWGHSVHIVGNSGRVLLYTAWKRQSERLSEPEPRPGRCIRQRITAL